MVTWWHWQAMLYAYLLFIWPYILVRQNTSRVIWWVMARKGHGIVMRYDMTLKRSKSKRSESNQLSLDFCILDQRLSSWTLLIFLFFTSQILVTGWPMGNMAYWQRCSTTGSNKSWRRNMHAYFSEYSVALLVMKLFTLSVIGHMLISPVAM